MKNKHFDKEIKRLRLKIKRIRKNFVKYIFNEII